MGVVDRGLGKYVAAEPLLKQAVALNPGQYDVRYNLGFVLAKLGKPQEALVQLEKAVQLKPDSSEAHFQLAAVLRSLGQEQKAQENYRPFQQQKQESIKENVAGTKVNQANEYLQSGRISARRRSLPRGHCRDSQTMRILITISHWLWIGLGKIAEERDALQKAISIDSRLARAHNQLGFLDLQAGQDGEAEKELKTAISLDPGICRGSKATWACSTASRERIRRRSSFSARPPKTIRSYAQAFVNLGLILASESRLCGSRTSGTQRVEDPRRSIPKPLACLPWSWPA